MSHCNIKKGYDLLIPKLMEVLPVFLLFPLFVAATPMILVAGAPIFTFTYSCYYTIERERDNRHWG